MTISGNNLANPTAVYFGSNPSSYFYSTSGGGGTIIIYAICPAGSAGPVDIRVTTAGGTSTSSSADLFTYSGLPVVTGLSRTV